MHVRVASSAEHANIPGYAKAKQLGVGWARAQVCGALSPSGSDEAADLLWSIDFFCKWMCSCCGGGQTFTPPRLPFTDRKRKRCVSLQSLLINRPTGQHPFFVDQSQETGAPCNQLLLALCVPAAYSAAHNLLVPLLRPTSGVQPRQASLEAPPQVLGRARARTVHIIAPPFYQQQQQQPPPQQQSHRSIAMGRGEVSTLPCGRGT